MDILESKQDIFGELAMSQPDEASYEFFSSILPPLRYVNAEFRYYPIVLSAPFEEVKARIISNGEGVNLRANVSMFPIWYDFGVPVRFILDDAEPFGSDLERLDGPYYMEDYLPIVIFRYSSTSSVYREEAFASVNPNLAEYGAIFVRFTILGKAGKITARIESSEELSNKGSTLVNSKGEALLWFDNSWRWEEKSSELYSSISPGIPAVLVIFTKPFNHDLPVLDSLIYDEELKQCKEKWQSLLSEGVKIETPEGVVNNAWRALICQQFILTKGNLLCYSIGNCYERQFEAECGDAVRSLLLFGYGKRVRDMIIPLLDYKQIGLAFHDAAFKLQMLCHYFWLTKDAEFIQEEKERWMKEVQLLVGSREPSTGLLPRENYCGDIGTQVYSLNSNANAWRGLRDISAVLKEIGETEESEKLNRIASDFREAILKAVAESERKDVSPPFIPIALFGDEAPYDTLTATTMGSYWCLMIPYVLGSGVLGDESERVKWILDYLHQKGGVFLGMVRFHQHSGAFANDNAVDDLYSLRYVLTLLRRDEVDRALVSFYGKLAQGLTPNTFIGCEGSGLIPMDKWGRPMCLPPNSASNAFFLWTLRYLLIQDWDEDDDGKPDTLKLLFATPRRWLKDGSKIVIGNAPTAFGNVSLEITSRIKRGEILGEISLPTHQPKSCFLRLRLPSDYEIIEAETRKGKLKLSSHDIINLTGLEGKISFRVKIREKQSDLETWKSMDY